MNRTLPPGWNWSPIGLHLIQQVQAVGELSAEEAVCFDRLRGVSNRDGIVDPPFDRIRQIKDPRRYVVLRPGFFAYNPMRINVGSIGLVRSENDQGKISPDYVVFSTQPSLDPEYLFAFLKSDVGQQLINHNAAGAIRQRLYFQDLAKLSIPVPPIEEQRRVTGLLREAEALRRLGIDADQLTDKLVTSIYTDMFGDPQSNPRRWPVVPVSSYVQDLQGGRSVLADAAESNEARYRVLKISAVTWANYRPDESKPVPADYEPPVEHIVRNGDLLFSRANTTALVGATTFVFDTPPNRLLPDKLWRFVWKNPASIDPLFIWGLFQQPAVRAEMGRRATGTSGSMKNISKPKVKSMAWPLPPLALQQAFSARIRSLRELQAAQRSARQRVEELQKVLTHRAFCGGISPASAPAQSPASAAPDVQCLPPTFTTDAEIAAAVIVELKAQGRPLTEYFVQKHMFVLKHREGLPIASQFRRKRAGPWSHELKQKAFFSGMKHNWFIQTDSTLTPGRSIGVGVTKAREFLGDRFDRIAVVVADLVKFGSNGLERWTTVLKVTLDLHDAGKLVTLNSIQAEIDAWPDKREKEAFTEESVEQTVVKMTRHGWLTLDA